MSKAKTTTGKKKTKASAAAKQGDPDVVPTAAIDVEMKSVLRCYFMAIDEVSVCALGRGGGQRLGQRTSQI